MKKLLAIRNSIENLYRRNSTVSGYVLRLIFGFLSLFIISRNAGYNEVISLWWAAVVIAAAAALLPMRLMTLVIMIYIVIEVGTLSVGIGAVILAVMAIVYLMYFRLDEKYLYALILIPVLSMVRLTLLVPLVLALVAPAHTVIAVISGNIIYYMLRYININAAVFRGMSGQSEVSKASKFIIGFFPNTEFLYTTVILVIVFFAVYYFKKLRINSSVSIAAAAGSGIYIVLRIAALLIFGGVTAQKLVYTVAGSVVSLILAVITAGIILPLDFARTEYIEFEDEEYHYYVRAVPKAVISEERVYVKNINRRRRGNRS